MLYAKDINTTPTLREKDKGTNTNNCNIVSALIEIIYQLLQLWPSFSFFP